MTEQYSRRYCLIFHDLPYNENENTDKLIQQFCFNKLGVKIYDTDLDRSNRLFTKSVSADPPIIAKFEAHNIKSNIYFQKRYLKNKISNHRITYRNKKKCMEKLERQRKQKEIYAFWSIDGRIHFIKNLLTSKKSQLMITQPF